MIVFEWVEIHPDCNMVLPHAPMLAIVPRKFCGLEKEIELVQLFFTISCDRWLRWDLNEDEEKANIETIFLECYIDYTMQTLFIRSSVELLNLMINTYVRSSLPIS